MVIVCAFLSAFLDALSVAAVIVSVCTGVLGVYYHAVENADLPLLETLHHETMSYELVPVREQKNRLPRPHRPRARSCSIL